MQSENKVRAIFELRHAAERKARAEAAVEAERSPEARDALLQASLELEDRTQTAIEVCHECGHEHGPDEPHGRR